MRHTEDFTLFFSKYDVFSNWYPCQFTIDGVAFNCVEQAMMYAKANTFGDKATAAKILASTDPKEQKALGRVVSPYVDAKWQNICRGVVYHACRAKFTQNPDLMDILLATGSRQLVEASPYDKVWGVGLGQNDPRIEDPTQWRGKNWLGVVLTKLRDDMIPTIQPSPVKRTP